MYPVECGAEPELESSHWVFRSKPCSRASTILPYWYINNPSGGATVLYRFNDIGSTLRSRRDISNV